jgi:predicted nucleic acid-binding protein
MFPPAMPWCCEDEATPASERMLSWAIDGCHLHVPSLWPWEMMNAVAVAVRRGRITADRTVHFFAQIATFDFRIAPAPSVSDFARLSILASRHQLTAYDTAYLDLARRLALPLATLDEDLRDGAIAEGVIVL